MTGSPTGEYAVRGDYHRDPSPDWEFYPTYLAKLAYVRGYLAALPDGTRVLDVDQMPTNTFTGWQNAGLCPSRRRQNRLASI